MLSWVYSPNKNIILTFYIPGFRRGFFVYNTFYPKIVLPFLRISTYIYIKKI